MHFFEYSLHIFTIFSKTVLKIKAFFARYMKFFPAQNSYKLTPVFKDIIMYSKEKMTSIIREKNEDPHIKEKMTMPHIKEKLRCRILKEKDNYVKYYKNY